MIVTEIYSGQGLGNQLWCYVVTRSIAKRNGLDFGIMHPEKMKSNDFMDLDFGRKVIGGDGPEGGPPNKLPDSITHYYRERTIRHPITNADISEFDQNLANIEDNTKIDGNMQDENYIIPYKDEIKNWLKVKEEFECFDYSDMNTCVINFRGGEYQFIKNVFLSKKYWRNAIDYMFQINPTFRFVVITDDVTLAKKFFPNFEVYHFSIGKDFAIIKNAFYLIIANTSFAWFPTWINCNLKLCIAPKYWWANNISDGYWACDSNLTRDWLYLDREGKFFSYEECKSELIEFKKKNKYLYQQVGINSNFLVISSYNNDYRWVAERTKNYIVFERGNESLALRGVNEQQVIRSPNVGYNLYDYFTYIIENYDHLPNCVAFLKGNLFPRHISESFFDQISNNNFYTPIFEPIRHKPRWPVSAIFSDTSYVEINNSWFLNEHPVKYFYSYNDFLKFCFKNPVIPKYIQFAPGANYIVPKQNILKLPKIFYENLRKFISYTALPGEAHIIERALHTIWTSNYLINEKMLKSVDELDNLEVLPCRPRSFTIRLNSFYLFLITPKSPIALLRKYTPGSFRKKLRYIFRIFLI